jgi:catechol 2,3-dioxygenase-like lactoylglutathione lyase family enzyme
MKRHIVTTIAVGAFCLGTGLVAEKVAAGGGKPKRPTFRDWSHLYVRAIDAEKTFNFYHKILGMDYVGSRTDSSRDRNNPKVYYYFVSGGVRLCVGAYPANPSDYKPMRMNRLYLHWAVDDLGVLYERLRNLGYQDMTEPRTSKWGARTFTVYDPNGIAIGITEWTGKSDWQQPKTLDQTIPFSG